MGTTESMARGLLKLKLKLPLLLRPRLKLIPGMDTMVDMVLDTTVDTMVDTTVDTTATPTTESMARGLLKLKPKLPLRLRPRLKLIPAMATPTEATTESMASKKGTSNSGLMSMKCHP